MNKSSNLIGALGLGVASAIACFMLFLLSDSITTSYGALGLVVLSSLLVGALVTLFFHAHFKMEERIQDLERRIEELEQK